MTRAADDGVGTGVKKGNPVRQGGKGSCQTISCKSDFSWLRQIRSTRASPFDRLIVQGHVTHCNSLGHQIPSFPDFSLPFFVSTHSI